MDGWLAKHRWLVLLSISAGSCICYIPYAWSAFQPLVAADLGYATDAATAVIPCCSLFYGLLSVLGGQWHNRSPQSVYLIGATAISCSYLLFCLSPPGASFFPVLCFGLTFGVGYGLIYSAATPCLLAWFPDRRGFAIGTMAGASGIFLSVFTYWGTDLVTRVGTRQGFFIFGLISAVVLFSTVPVIGIPPHTSQIRSRQPTLQLTDSTNGHTSRQMIHSNYFWLLFGSVALVLPAYQLFSSQLYTLGMSHRLSAASSLLLVSVNPAFSSLGSFLIPPATDRYGRVKIIVLLWGLVFLSAFLIPYSTGILFVLLYLIQPFAYYGGSSAAVALVVEFFGQQHSRENISIFNFTVSAGSLLTILYSQAEVFFPSAGASMRAGSISAAIAFLCSLLLVRRKKPRFLHSQ